MNQITKVPFITLNRFENGFKENFLKGVESLVENTQFVGGPVVGELELALAQKTQTKYAIGCANGTDAIQVALRAVGVQKNDLVLIPDMTFWATFEAVVNVGANPVTIDVSKETCHLELETFKAAAEKYKPKAAIIVHLYGHASPDTQAIRKYCKDQNILLIEDGAQCFGVELNGESIFKQALISTTSFYPAKVLGASGDAGAIFTNDEELNKKVRILINHGRTDHYSHGMIGWNSRIGAYESLFLKLSLEHIDERIKSRMKAVQYYHRELQGLPLQVKLAHSSIKENGYCAVLMIDPTLRPALIESLKNAQIGYGTIYPGAMSLQAGADGHLAGKIDFGNADYVSKAVLNLPCFQYITEEELKYVCDVVKNHFKK